MGCKISELLKSREGRENCCQAQYLAVGEGAGSAFQSLGGILKPEAPSVHRVPLKGISELGFCLSISLEYVLRSGRVWLEEGQGKTRIGEAVPAALGTEGKHPGNT